MYSTAHHLFGGSHIQFDSDFSQSWPVYVSGKPLIHYHLHVNKK